MAQQGSHLTVPSFLVGGYDMKTKGYLFTKVKLDPYALYAPVLGKKGEHFLTIFQDISFVSNHYQLIHLQFSPAQNGSSIVMWTASLIRSLQ